MSRAEVAEDADRERGGRGVGPVACHRHDAIDVLQARDAGPLEGNRREFTLPLAIDLELNDLDLDVVPDRVVRTYRTVDRAAVVELPIGRI